MLRRRYKRDGASYRRLRPRQRLYCWRGTWATDRHRVHMWNGPHGGHISTRRGGWLYQFFRYCGEETEPSLVPAHDPLKWLDAHWLSPQRHNGIPILVGAMENERDHPPYGVEEWR